MNPNNSRPRAHSGLSRQRRSHARDSSSEDDARRLPSYNQQDSGRPAESPPPAASNTVPPGNHHQHHCALDCESSPQTRSGAPEHHNYAASGSSMGNSGVIQSRGHGGFHFDHSNSSSRTQSELLCQTDVPNDGHNRSSANQLRPATNPNRSTNSNSALLLQQPLTEEYLSTNGHVLPPSFNDHLRQTRDLNNNYSGCSQAPSHTVRCTALTASSSSQCQTPNLSHADDNYTGPGCGLPRVPSHQLRNGGDFSGRNAVSMDVGHAENQPPTINIRNSINAIRTANTAVASPQRYSPRSPAFEKFKFKFHLLPGPVNAPLNNQLVQQYTDLGFGRQEIKLYKFYSKEQIDAAIRRKYPMLNDSSYGIYQHSPTTTRGTAVFLRVCARVPRMSVFWENKRRIHYIRPDEHIWHAPDDDEISSNSDSTEDDDSAPAPAPVANSPAELTPNADNDVAMATPPALVLPQLLPPPPVVVPDRTVEQYFQYYRIDGTRTIQVDRDQFSHQFLNPYRTEDLEEVFKTLRIEFVNEPGFDAGGLSREYFCLLRHELLHGVMHNSAIFTGNGNNLLLTCMPELLENNIYYLAGRSCADIALHSGFAFKGLSLCMVDLLRNPINAITQNLRYSLDDICEWDVMEAAIVLSSIANESSVTEADKAACIQTAEEWGIHIPLTVCSQNALWYKKQLMESFVIGKRLLSLSQFRKGLSDGGLHLFFEQHELGWETVFPRVGASVVTVADIRGKLRYTGHVAVRHRVEALIDVLLRTIEHDVAAVKELLLQWTGSDHLTRGPLTVNAIDRGDPFFHSCTGVFDVPVDIPIDIFVAAMSGSHSRRFTNH